MFYSGNQVIQRIQRNRRRTTSGISSLNRMSKSPGAKVEPLESGKYHCKENAQTFFINFIQFLIFQQNCWKTTRGLNVLLV